MQTDGFYLPGGVANAPDGADFKMEVYDEAGTTLLDTAPVAIQGGQYLIDLPQARSGTWPDKARFLLIATLPGVTPVTKWVEEEGSIVLQRIGSTSGSITLSPADTSLLTAATQLVSVANLPTDSTWGIWAGSALNLNDYYNSGAATTPYNGTDTLTGLPTDGSTIFIRLELVDSGSNSTYQQLTYTAHTASACTGLFDKAQGEALFEIQDTGGTPITGDPEVGTDYILKTYWLDCTGSYIDTGDGVAIIPVTSTAGAVSFISSDVPGGFNLNSWTPTASGPVTFEWGKYDDVAQTGSQVASVVRNISAGAPSLSPANGFQITGGSQSFTINNLNTAHEWELKVGSSAGGTQYFGPGYVAGTTATQNVTGLPTDGSTVHVEWSHRVDSGSSATTASQTHSTSVAGSFPADSSPIAEGPNNSMPNTVGAPVTLSTGIDIVKFRAGGDGTAYSHQYSKTRSINANNTKIILRNLLGPETGLFDIASGALSAQLPITSAHNFSATDPDVIIGLSYNPTQRLVRYLVSTGSATDYTTSGGAPLLADSIGSGEGQQSTDDSMIVLKNGNALQIWDISNPTACVMTGQVSADARYNWATITPSGSHMFVENNDSDGTEDFHKLYNTSGALVTDFEVPILSGAGYPRASHGDMGVDSNGDDIFIGVGTNGQPYYLHLATSIFYRWDEHPSAPWVLNGHVCGNATSRPGGYQYFTANSLTDGTVLNNDVFTLKAEPTATATTMIGISSSTVRKAVTGYARWSSAGFTTQSYNHQPMASVSADGTHVAIKGVENLGSPGANDNEEYLLKS